MNKTDALTIKVNISPELRQLRGRRQIDAAPTKVAPETPRPVQTKAPARGFQGLPARDVRMRQDGARPIRFRGVPVFDVEDRLPTNAEGFVHQFTLFLKEGGGVYAAVRLEPDQGLALRPSYRSAALGDSLQLDAWLEKWQRDVIGPALAQTKPHRRRASDQVSAAFQTLTGGCLRSASPLLERNEQCLQ